MPARNCEYYKARNTNDRINCLSCQHWGRNKCQIERLVKCNGKTELVHEYFPGSGRSRQVTGLLR